MSTTIPESDRFLAVEITKIFWLPAVANLETGPTRAEITAGTELSTEIVDLSGWDATPNNFNVNTLGSRFSPSMTGRTAMGAASITYTGSLDGQDIRQVHAVGDKGFILIADGGDEPGYLADLYPATVSALTPLRTVTEQEHRVTASYSIPNRPRAVTLPAAA